MTVVTGFQKKLQHIFKNLVFSEQNSILEQLFSHGRGDELRFLCMELKPKISVFMLLCVQTSGVRAFKCFGIKIVVPPCVHVFKPEKSELSHFLALNFCVLVRSCVQTWRYGSVMLELGQKFLRSCICAFKSVMLELFNFFGIKIVVRSCVHAFMRSIMEVWLSQDRIGTKNFCIHAFVRWN